MRSRSLYRILLRLHPECFRKQYEEQMLWIFDESVQSRGAVSLLLDAVVSLARQWVLRSGYWQHGQQTMLADGAVALSEQLRRNAEVLHRRAWRLNLVWMVGAFIVLLLSRQQLIWSWLGFFIFANAIGMYLQSSRGGVRAGENEYTTLSLSRNPEDAQKLYRQQIEGKRKGLVEWCRFKPSEISWKVDWHLGGKFLLVLLIVAGLSMLFRPLRPGTSYDWMSLIEFLSGLIVLLSSWRFVRKVNERAVQAIQDELDAMDEPPKSQSV